MTNGIRREALILKGGPLPMVFLLVRENEKFQLLPVGNSREGERSKGAKFMSL